MNTAYVKLAEENAVALIKLDVKKYKSRVFKIIVAFDISYIKQLKKNKKEPTLAGLFHENNLDIFSEK